MKGIANGAKAQKCKNEKGEVMTSHIRAWQ